MMAFTQHNEASVSLGGVGDGDVIVFSPELMRAKILEINSPVYAVKVQDKIGLTMDNRLIPAGNAQPMAGYVPSMRIEDLGDKAFCQTYGTRYALYGGSMANGISSVKMVIALGKAGFMGSFGAGGVSIGRVEDAIRQVQEALPEGPYLFNVLNSPGEPVVERGLIDLYLAYGVRAIEASAYLDISLPLAHYRIAGLDVDSAGNILIRNRVIAKVSRKEIAQRFMMPIAPKLIKKLLEEGRITQKQAELAAKVPVADDITVEADSGGHTDNRPLVSLIPAMRVLRDQIQAKQGYAVPVRIGAAGGIATPEAALAAFGMGAAYVVTGSINQACVEADTSEHVRKLLAVTDMTDVCMAPAADRFEAGVRVQVVKRGTMFAVRSARLFDLYNRYASLDELPEEEREKLEAQIFQHSMTDIWEQTVCFFSDRDPRQIALAESDPKQKMALVFRWYLGLSARWACMGEPGREMDYQIWCGPSMGAFNDWVRGSYLEPVENRRAADIAKHILTGCAYYQRLLWLKVQGIDIADELKMYHPDRVLVSDR